MNRLSKCIQFRLKGTLKSTAWFLAIYSVICLFLFLLMAQLTRANSNGSGSINSGFYLTGAIFIFVSTIAAYKSNFNFLLIFGNTRKHIFLSAICTLSILSIVLSGISLLAQLFDKAATAALLGSSNNSPDMIGAIYGSGANAATEFVWFLGLFIVVFSFAMLYSALAYKMGKAFVTCFWVAFSLSWIVLPATVTRSDVFVNALKAYFCYGVPNGILLAPVNFLITAIVFCAGAYAVSARQPQVA